MKWRRGRDSNPRYTSVHAGFQDRCIQPLCHPSAGISHFVDCFGAVSKGFSCAQAVSRRLLKILCFYTQTRLEAWRVGRSRQCEHKNNHRKGARFVNTLVILNPNTFFSVKFKPFLSVSSNVDLKLPIYVQLNHKNRS